MVDTLLRVESLDVERGGRLVIGGLSLVLARGEIVLASGRNGSGKSTLLRTLAGFLVPRAGTVAYGLTDENTRGVETVHYLGYEDALKPTLSVGENLGFWAAMLAERAGTPGSGLDVADALARFGIGRLANLPAAYLSAGQKRRVALARLLLVHRPVWLLDEPLIALDVAAQATLAGLMDAHAKRGGAILVASHQPLALPHREIFLESR